MAADPATQTTAPRPTFFGRLNALETIVVAVIALVAMAGLLMITKGVYLKAAEPDAGEARVQANPPNGAVLTQPVSGTLAARPIN